MNKMNNFNVVDIDKLITRMLKENPKQVKQFNVYSFDELLETLSL